MPPRPTAEGRATFAFHNFTIGQPVGGIPSSSELTRIRGAGGPYCRPHSPPRGEPEASKCFNMLHSYSPQPLLGVWGDPPKGGGRGRQPPKPTPTGREAESKAAERRPQHTWQSSYLFSTLPADTNALHPSGHGVAPPPMRGGGAAFGSGGRGEPMARRSRMSSSGSQAHFSRHAARTHRKNILGSPHMRGGIRL